VGRGGNRTANANGYWLNVEKHTIMKRNICLIIYIFASILAPFGCQKDTVSGSKSILNNQVFPSAEGEMHNAFLDSVTCFETFPDHNETDLISLGQTFNPEFWNDSLLIAIGFFNEGYADTSLFADLLEEVVSRENMEECLDYINNNWENDFSSLFFNKLIELDAIIRSDSTLHRLNDNRISFIMNDIKDFHSSIFSLEISPLEKFALRKNAEIAYYSVMYWAQAYHNPDHPWHDAIWPVSEEDPPTWWEKALKASAQIGLDVTGFAVGAAVGIFIGRFLVEEFDLELGNDGPVFTGAGGLGLLIAKEASGWIK
jgi:hypothetical protein